MTKRIKPCWRCGSPAIVTFGTEGVAYLGCYVTCQSPTCRSKGNAFLGDDCEKKAVRWWNKRHDLKREWLDVPDDTGWWFYAHPGGSIAGAAKVDWRQRGLYVTFQTGPKRGKRQMYVTELLGYWKWTYISPLTEADRAD